MITVKIPIKANRNKYSATFSSLLSIFSVLVLIEIKDRMHERERNIPTIDVNSLI